MEEYKKLLKKDGNAWERYALEHLRKKYSSISETELVFVPAADGGDLGIEAFTRTQQTVFQCYAAENYESVHELYEKQRDKITKDIGKLSYQNKIIEIKNLLGENTLIKQWILVVPQHRSRHLISHANKKAEELKKDQNRPSYISEDFVAHIWTEEDLIANCGRLENSIEEITQIFSIRGPWAQLVYKSELWPLETDPILKISSAKIADLCWEYIDESNNPWSDNDYPSRIIKNILLIIKQLDNLKLTTEEVIFLLTIPFLKHVLIYLTENIQFDCAQINDLKPNSDLSVSNVYREQYEMFIAKCPQLERKAIRLQSQGKNEFSWITWWIFSKSIRNIPSTFSFDYKNTNDEFFNQYSEITKNISKLKKIENYRSLLISDGIDIDEIINRPDVFESQSILENKSKTIRLSIISIIFSLAGKMSFDPLMLSGAIVDHINVSYPTSPEMVLSNLRSTNWILESNSFQLDLTCNHPAIDLAISEVVDKLSFFHKYILQYIKEKKSNFQELTNLPQFKKDRLHSKKINGLDIYLKPHVSFKLSQDEIKELLMGEKLYSNPTFAIRELYQNALDACRYQETRYKYLLKKSGLSEDEIPWKGKIKIEQGIDPDRGVYIECIDNGIGMRQSDIINFFAKAGKRFVEGDDYLQEKIDWQKFGLEHYPNSQFGIGVFSYFMLAEEIEITTRYVNKDQSLENTLLVNISGSGSLLHIRNTKNEMISHGTKIRLYLHKTSYKDINENEIKISALSTLKEHLWIAYFKTSVIEGEQNQIWEPFELNSKNKSLSMHKKASELDLIKIDNDLWWLGEDDIGFIDNKDVKGRILADGLITETKVPSLLVNLHGKNRSRLSLDRRKILDWPKNKIESKLNEFGWKALIDKPFMKALSFYVVAKYYPIVIQQFLAHWNNQLKLPLKTLYVDTQYDLKELGISIDDLELMSFVQGGRVVADDELDGWIRFLMHKNKDDIVQRFLSLRSQIALKPYVIEWLERQSDFSNDTNYIHNKKNTISDINSIEFKIKNYYSKFSINNPILFMDKINNINQIDDIDIEIFSDEIGFPTNKVSKWKLFLLIFTNKISKDVLLEKLRKWSVISNIEDIDGKYNNDNLGLSFINDKFTIPISDSFFLFKIISNEIARNIEINKLIEIINNWKKIGLIVPETIEAALIEIDDIDKLLISRSTNLPHLICRDLIDFIIKGEINISDLGIRINRYKSIGIPTKYDNFDSIISKEDAIEINNLSNQFVVSLFSFMDRFEKLNENTAHLKQALKWYSDNNCPTPQIDWEEIIKNYYSMIDKSILKYLSPYNYYLNYDVCAASIIIYGVSKNEFESKIKKYKCLGIEIPMISAFEKVWNFIETLK